MRVAIVHHWFVTRGGGERVAECIASLFPDAEIFTLVSDSPGVPASLSRRKLHTSFLQRIPLARQYPPAHDAALRDGDRGPGPEGVRPGDLVRQWTD